MMKIKKRSKGISDQETRELNRTERKLNLLLSGEDVNSGLGRRSKRNLVTKRYSTYDITPLTVERTSVKESGGGFVKKNEKQNKGSAIKKDVKKSGSYKKITLDREKVFRSKKESLSLEKKKSSKDKGHIPKSLFREKGLLQDEDDFLPEKDKLELKKKQKRLELERLSDVAEKTDDTIEKKSLLWQESKKIIKKKTATKDNVSKINIGGHGLNSEIKQISVLKTPFDHVIDLVEKEGRVPLSRVVSLFHINKNIAQEWGQILSDGRLIDFHIPAFGEPEFRKIGIVIHKKKIKGMKFLLKGKINKKKLILIGGISGLIILMFFGLFVGFRVSEKEVPGVIEGIPQVVEDADGGKSDGVVDDVVLLAFSGNGSYECRSEDGGIRYAIKNTLLKIEELDGSSKVVIKNNKTYALNIKTGVWIETSLRESLPVPGTGRYPKTILHCLRAPIELQEFST